MRVKKIVIKSRDNQDKEEIAFAKKIDRGEKVRPLRGEYFESLEAVRKFLTDARLELWRTVRDQKPKSITELALIVKRNFSDVHQDIRILVEAGLISLYRPKAAKTRAMQPISLVDRLEFRVA